MQPRSAMSGATARLRRQVARLVSTGIEAEDLLVAVPGGNIFVRRWISGSDDLEPIILLHDSLGSVEKWHDFPVELAESSARSVIAYDRLGFGKSSPRTTLPGTQFILEEAQVYFPALVRALGLNSYVLFGHSVGGGMALSVAALHPGQCKAVISESAQAFVEKRTIAGIEAARESFRAAERFAKLEKWHGDKARWVLDAWTQVWLAPEFRSWSLVPYLKDVQCPVLAIHGSEDEYGSEEFPRTIVRHVRGPARLEILKDCGHLPHREMKDVVLSLVSDFIQRGRRP
jgi:pimeloyl-ACP methyl ester carboxylesterase